MRYSNKLKLAGKLSLNFVSPLEVKNVSQAWIREVNLSNETGVEGTNGYVVTKV